MPRAGLCGPCLRPLLLGSGNTNVAASENTSFWGTGSEQRDALHVKDELAS